MTYAERPALHLIQGSPDVDVGWEWFCGRCAAPPPGGEAPAPTARVCPTCNFGILLEARANAVPSDGDSFLVVDSALLVQAMSSRAETLLGFAEDAVVGRPVAELLVPADAEAGGPTRFIAAILDALGRSDQPVHASVRPWNTFGVRIRARIGACGPPRAALIVLETQPGPLRAVRS
jgi:hypothetical protein